MKATAPSMQAIDVWDVLTSLVLTEKSMGRVLKNPVLNLNHISGCIPNAGTIPNGAFGFDGLHLNNIVVGAAAQWCGQLYDKLVKVYGYRVYSGPNPNPTAGLYRLSYQDPAVAAASLLPIADIVLEDGTRSDYVELVGGPVIGVEFVFTCITYDADADIFQEVELIGEVLE